MSAASAAISIPNPRSILKQIIIATAKRAVPIIIVGAIGGYVTYRLVKAYRSRHDTKPKPPEGPDESVEEPVEPTPPRGKPKRARSRKARPEPA